MRRRQLFKKAGTKEKSLPLVLDDSPKREEDTTCPRYKLKQFDPTPGKHLQPKVEYFYSPYHKETGYPKHMHFDNTRNTFVKEQITQSLKTDELQVE